MRGWGLERALGLETSVLAGDGFKVAEGWKIPKHGESRVFGSRLQEVLGLLNQAYPSVSKILN